MKNIISIPLPKEEDIAALNKRRDNYAATRDLQALEFNEAIIKRIQAEARHLIKCDKCGKEFASVTTEETSLSCPECIAKP
jgi:rRNA maturation endonuclease Nob1